MEDRIKQVLSDVLNIDIKYINNKTSTKNNESWDSLKHMNLIIALEEEFNIELTDEEILLGMDYESIVGILNDK
jgi:acyl carrier protein|tara:strand:- start:122 stop:343 length:222 start_codon:yes stop_codon:yes gene_type:complete